MKQISPLQCIRILYCGISTPISNLYYRHKIPWQIPLNMEWAWTTTMSLFNILIVSMVLYFILKKYDRNKRSPPGKSTLCSLK